MSIEQHDRLGGVIPAILTPMDESGEVDYGLLETQAAYLSDAGVNGFFVGGTTAEGAYLTTGEKRQIYQCVRSVASKDQFLCAAYIQPSTRAVLEEMYALSATHPDYIVAVTPYYHAMGQDDIVAHYRTLAKSSSAPVILYNIPGNTHNAISEETITLLAGEKNIIGLKDSSGDFVGFSRGLLGDQGTGFRWIQGSDLLDAPSLMLGCAGVVTGLGNARIDPYVKMYSAVQDGDVEAVRECQAKINRLHRIIDICGNSVAAVKAAAELSGRGSRWLRQKSQSLSDDAMRRIARILEEHDQA